MSDTNSLNTHNQSSVQGNSSTYNIYDIDGVEYEYEISNNETAEHEIDLNDVVSESKNKEGFTEQPTGTQVFSAVYIFLV